MAAQGSAAAVGTSPCSVGAGLGLGRDDNLFFAPANQAVSDSYAVTQLCGDHDQSFGLPAPASPRGLA